MGKKSTQNQNTEPFQLGVTAIKPPERHGWDIVKYFIRDPEKGEYFTRTPKSWFQITLFFCVYYFLLGCFWYGMLNVFFIFLPFERPMYILEESIIGTNPGVGMMPNQPDVTIDSSMLFLKYNDDNTKPSDDFESASNIDWAKRYELFLTKFDNMTSIRECTEDKVSKEDQQACKFDVSVLQKCSEFPYGFVLQENMQQVQPCVLLKINRIFGWKPEPYTDEDLAALDDTEDPVPENVKTLIRQNRNKIYLNCQGENPADIEALAGDNMKYFPEDQGISFKYFPYNHAHENYHNPLVAVKFSGIPVGQLIHIECKLWAKGVIHDRKHRMGQVHFEVFLDN